MIEKMMLRVQSEAMVIEELTQAKFSDHLGEVFQLEADVESCLTLQLMEAKQLFSSQNANLQIKRSEPFALVFRGPQNLPLVQATYQLQHDQLGELAIFLVPIDQDEEGFYYEAIFN